ncbi:hypothetical protein MMC31_000593 [Peltigera leucophlebia]|nr:hypothetical protein [Peltigera leucophlebia]
MAALVRHDADRRVVKRYQEVEDSEHPPQKGVRPEGDDRYSKFRFINSWVEQVVKEAKLYSFNREKIPLKTQKIPGYPNTPCLECLSDEDQSVSSTSRANDTNYTRALESYYMFSDEYDPPQELLDKVRAILWKTRPKQLDPDTARQIQKSARTLRQASEDMVSSTIGKDLFPFLFTTPDQLRVSKNIEWTEVLNISSPDWTSPPPPISFPKPDVSVGIHPRKGLSLQQLQTANMFQEERRTFAQPDKRGGLFPGLVVECKSAGTTE